MMQQFTQSHIPALGSATSRLKEGRAWNKGLVFSFSTSTSPHPCLSRVSVFPEAVDHGKTWGQSTREMSVLSQPGSIGEPRGA